MKDRKLLLGLLGGCGCLTVVVAGVVVALLFMARGPASPFAGDGGATVVLTSEEGQGPVVAPILVARFEELGVTATATEVEAQRIVLELEGVRDPGGAVRAVIAPRRLAMQLAAEDQTPLTIAGVDAAPGLSLRESYDGPTLLAGPDPSSLAPVVARAADLPGRDAVVECDSEEGAHDCVAYLVEAPPPITNADVASASVSTDTYDGRPAVFVTFTAEGGRRFADLTARGVRRKLAIILDEEVVSAPIIMERIAGGTAQITLGGDSMEELLEEAHGLAAGLSTEPLPTRWTYAEVRQ